MPSSAEGGGTRRGRRDSCFQRRFCSLHEKLLDRAVTPASPSPPSQLWCASSLAPQWSPVWALAGTRRLKAGAEASGVTTLPGPTRFQPSATCSADPARLRARNADATPPPSPRGPTSPSANTDEPWAQQLGLPPVSAASLRAQWPGHTHAPPVGSSPPSGNEPSFSLASRGAPTKTHNGKR